MFSRLFGGPSSSSSNAAPAYADTAAAPVSDAHPASASLPSATGALYSSPVASPSAQTCVFLQCIASVRPTATPFSAELLVVGGDDDQTSDALLFEISATARFSADVDGSTNSVTRISWRNASGATRYSLDLDDEGRDLVSAVRRALYENREGASADGASEDDLGHVLLSENSLRPSDLLQAAGELVRVDADLFHYDLAKETFVVMQAGVVASLNSAVSRDDGSRAYLLMVFRGDTGVRVMENEVDNFMSAQFYAQTLSMVWVLNQDPDADTDKVNSGEFDAETQMCLSLRFSSKSDFERMQNQFAVALFEVTNQASMDSLKLKDDDRQYIIRSTLNEYEAMDIDDKDGDGDGDGDGDSGIDRDDFLARTIREDGPSSRTSLQPSPDGFTNSQLAVAVNNDRTFVVRGDKLGVLSHSGTSGVEHKTTVRFNDPRHQGQTFRPSRMLLHEKDSSLLLLDQNDSNRVLKMDLERGEVVESWGGADQGSSSGVNITVSALHRTEKYANLTHNQEFVALNQNQLLRLDPRTSQFVVQSKLYAKGTRARLEAVATTGAGYLATASENGDIRLFDAIGKNAKTHLPGLGDKVIGIDVTEDGNFVLATTTKYLLVIDTRVKGETKGGFLKSMGKNKPQPIKLTISPQDQAKYRMGAINFTSAHFNTGASLERSIVTSTGPFIVTWSFRAVKQGKKEAYQVKRYRDTIVADEFEFGNDGKIVVTLPNDVCIA
jgi:VID27 C-terminal WD40-like domain/VID27 PH-like domain